MKLLLVAMLAALSAGAQPSLFIIGDSTANNTGHRGWGDPIADFLDPAKLHVVNRARAGRSSRTFFTEGLWDAVREELKPGDFVLIQFGHNDGGPPDKDRARGSLPGISLDEKEFLLPNGKQELVHTFGWYLRRFIADARSKNATPIVLSPTVRNIWKDGQVEHALGRYAEWSAEVAAAENVPFLDVGASIAARYQALGPERVAALFPEDHTHTSPAGATLTAWLVVAGLKTLPNGPFKADLRLPTPENDTLPSLFLIGDSTVRNGHGDGSNGQWGWGDFLGPFFDAAKINVVNRAVGGLSSRTFYTLGHWDRVKAMLKPGDLVMMQFGHNDGGPLDDTARARGTLKGAGDEVREIDNPLTHQHEVVHTYGWYLRQFIAETRAAGAVPMVCTLVPRKIWKNGRIARNSEDYAKWAREVAAAESAPVVDLNELVAQHYDDLGPEKVEALFGDEHTHTSRAGAELNAQTVLEGLKALPANPLAPYFAQR